MLFSEKHQVLAEISMGVEPRSYKEAMEDGIWNNAMFSEIDSLEEKKMWDLETLPEGKKVIRSKWIFKLKFNADGMVERYKRHDLCV